MNSQFELYCGDCAAILPTLAANSVDAVITDPPYGITFMGSRWDCSVPGVATWAECLRVLKPGGQLGILEFSQPGGLLGKGYAFYFHHILPAIGRLICGKDGPYSYLPASVGRFPAPTEMLELMQAAGFAESSWTPYTFGIAGLYMGR